MAVDTPPSPSSSPELLSNGEMISSVIPSLVVHRFIEHTALLGYVEVKASAVVRAAANAKSFMFNY